MTDLLRRLPANRRQIVDSIAAVARRRGQAAYLVGGAVRDLVLRRHPRDLDIVIEGDAVAFARSWAAENHRALEAPSLFGTIRTSGLEADLSGVEFASARREIYTAPAALPQVFGASIDEDLRRRDFTVNAMALAIAGARTGEFIDPGDGLNDLRARVLRLLHDGSISDDPTRAFRALRYAVRLAFRIEPSSLAAIERERRAGLFDAVSGPRLRRELELLLGQCGSQGLRQLDRRRLTSVILPRLRVLPAALARLDRARTLSRRVAGIDVSRLLLLAWLSDLSSRSIAMVADRLDYRAESRRSITSMGLKRRLAIRDAGREHPSGEFGLELRQWTAEEAIAAAAWLSPARARRLLRRWQLSRRMRLRISGDDLIRSGVAPGPSIGRSMKLVWRARLEGRLSAGEELAFAIRQARR